VLYNVSLSNLVKDTVSFLSAISVQEDIKPSATWKIPLQKNINEEEEGEEHTTRREGGRGGGRGRGRVL